jgi:hypothetical protein
VTSRREIQRKIDVAIGSGARRAHENRVLANATKSRREARELREQAEILEDMTRRHVARRRSAQ